MVKLKETAVAAAKTHTEDELKSARANSAVSQPALAKLKETAIAAAKVHTTASSTALAMKAEHQQAEKAETGDTQSQNYPSSSLKMDLCIYHNLPCFFSQTELETFLGYVSPNHNVAGTISLMVKYDMIGRSEDSISTTKYYLHQNPLTEWTQSNQQ